METFLNQQQDFMQLVYDEVKLAIQEGNRPFASIITDQQNKILAKTHNQVNTKNLFIAHGEIEAIRTACAVLGQKRLTGCAIYVNAESCAMCSGAIIKSGISKVYYGANAPLTESSPNLYLREINEKANPKLEIYGGIMEEKFRKQILSVEQQQLIFPLQKKQTDSVVEIWTDGACVYNGTPRARAAWAFVADAVERSGLVPGSKQTNNVAEGLAILHGLMWAAESGYKTVKLYTDSQISLYNVRKPAKLVKQNREIFEQIEDTIKENHLVVYYEKVLGHSGEKNNERADKLANQLAASYS